MTKLAPAMYAICEREAKRKGPVKVSIDGSMKTAFIMSREELNKEFRRNGFKKDGIAWLKMVMDFRDVFDAVAPNDSVILNPNEKWVVAFTTVTKSEYLTLQEAAEEFQAPILARIP